MCDSKEQYCKIEIVGIIKNQPELKVSKRNQTWICLKIKTCNSNGNSFFAKVKIFGDVANEVFLKYHQNDIVKVFGDAEISKYMQNGKLFADLDVFPKEIKLLKKSEQKIIPIKLS